jgi:hypothetical protein
MADTEKRSTSELESRSENKLGRVIMTVCLGGSIYLGVQLLGIIGAILGVIIGITIGSLLSNLVSPKS